MLDTSEETEYGSFHRRGDERTLIPLFGGGSGSRYPSSVESRKSLNSILSGVGEPDDRVWKGHGKRCGFGFGPFNMLGEVALPCPKTSWAHIKRMLRLLLAMGGAQRELEEARKAVQL